ncbi:hypothetical protein MMC25_001365 [Agyrium rufum]|nr:hypothetical protein [Agyrium rufum]
MDVFAHAFIPQAFKIINDIPCRILSDERQHLIDYQTYVASFAGQYFLNAPRSQSFPRAVHSASSIRAAFAITSTEYGEHLGACFALEYEAHCRVIQSANMYGVVLGIFDAARALYTLRVPGLMDGNPQVDIGDMVLIRQLIIDPTTQLPMRHTQGPLSQDGMAAARAGFTGVQHAATVWSIIRGQEEVVLCIPSFSHYLGSTSFNVAFTVPDETYQALWRAKDHITGSLYVQGAHERSEIPPQTDSMLDSCIHPWIRRMLFPNELDGVQTVDHPKGFFKQQWVDDHLNFEQQKAVDAIQGRNYGCVPFLVSGPPGSGKTKLVCEAVLQLLCLKRLRGSILVCAPSDQAADIIALRLQRFVGTGDLFRLIHPSRTFESVSGSLLPWCHVIDNHFGLPPFPTLMSYKIIVATCRAADMLVQACATNRNLAEWQWSLTKTINPFVPDDQPKHVPVHWSDLIVDEAAQATELELLIPLSVVAPPANLLLEHTPRLVLIGDQFQLGPRLYEKGTAMSTSLLERLFARRLYSNHPLARTNLRNRAALKFPMLIPPFANFTRNYRSHPAMLAIPSSLFYHNTLIPQRAGSTSPMASWEGWKGRKWPVMFLTNPGLEACQDLEVTCQGWYNQREANIAVDLASSIVQSGRVRASNICIMTPFVAQVRLIRKMCRASGMYDVNVGPDYVFQGLEFPIVIVCTTRVRSRFLENDHRSGAGIIGEEKKFNVAITRAQDGLFVVGNPWTLAQDRCWEAFLSFCWRNSLWHENEVACIKDVDLDEPNSGRWAPSPSQVRDNAGLEAAMLYQESIQRIDADDHATSLLKPRRQLGLQRAEDPMQVQGIAAEAALREMDKVEEDLRQSHI